jgi:hypothetical protein
LAPLGSPGDRPMATLPKASGSGLAPLHPGAPAEVSGSKLAPSPRAHGACSRGLRWHPYPMPHAPTQPTLSTPGPQEPPLVRSGCLPSSLGRSTTGVTCASGTLTPRATHPAGCLCQPGLNTRTPSVCVRRNPRFRVAQRGPVLGGIVDAHVRPRVLRCGCPPLPPGLRSTASPGALFCFGPRN